MPNSEILSYRDFGKGNCIVLVHGFCEDKTIWKDILEALKDSFRVITVDLPGFGESKRISQTASMEWFAERLHATLSYLNINNFILAGHSLGGYVSIAYAEKYTENLKGLALIHSTTFEDNPEKKTSRSEAIEFVESNSVEKYARSTFNNLFSVSSRKKVPAKIEQFLRVASKTSRTAFVDTMKAMAQRPDRSNALKTLEIPVLFLVGKEDSSIPLEQSLKEIILPKESWVNIFEDVGHMGMLEEEEKTIKLLSKFTSYCFSINP